MATLRAPDGCPWDREQTIDSLKPFVLEETYEVLEAIDRHDHAALCEELGDFLFEAVFLAQLEAEAGHFTIADSLKQRRRQARAAPSARLRARARAKPRSTPRARSGRGGRRSRRRSAARRGQSTAEDAARAASPPALPALLRAYHIGTRAASVGFDWSGAGDVVDKIQEEVDELRRGRGRAGRRSTSERAEEEMGDLLFAIANLSRKLGIEPETALRKANDKFTRRFGTLEQSVADVGPGDERHDARGARGASGSELKAPQHAD